jgi:hypothetical protein
LDKGYFDREKQETNSATYRVRFLFDYPAFTCFPAAEASRWVVVARVPAVGFYRWQSLLQALLRFPT